MPHVDALRVFESRVGYYLGRDRVIYSTRLASLYFWEGDAGRVQQILSSTLAALGLPYRDTPVVIDNKGVFRGPRKLSLAGEALSVVSVALRVAGIEMIVDDTDFNNWKEVPA